MTIGAGYRLLCPTRGGQRMKSGGLKSRILIFGLRVGWLRADQLLRYNGEMTSWNSLLERQYGTVAVSPHLFVISGY